MQQQSTTTTETMRASLLLRLLLLASSASSLVVSVAAQSGLPPPVVAAAPSIKEWPEQDVPPPIVKEWTALFDLESDKAFKIPVRAPGTAAAACPEVAADSSCAYSCYGCLRDSDIVSVPAGHWGITFDDGPSADTVSLLDKAKALGIRITFFVVASRVISNPQILRRAYAEGHEIAIHTWSHTMLTSQTNDEIIAEIMWSALAIYNSIGVVPTYMRPPFGDSDDRVRAIMKLMGLKMIIWTFDAEDWHLATSPPSMTNSEIEKSVSAYITRALANTTVGPITLEHDLYKVEAQEGLRIIDMIMATGLKVGPVAELIGDSHPYQTADSKSRMMAGLGSTSVSVIVTPNGNGSVVVPTNNATTPANATTSVVVATANASSSTVSSLSSSSSSSRAVVTAYVTASGKAPSQSSPSQKPSTGSAAASVTSRDALAWGMLVLAGVAAVLL